MSPRVARPGRARPGVVIHRDDVEFGVVSHVAEQVFLCLLDGDPEAGRLEEHLVPMWRGEGGLWHARVTGVQPGQRYGYRVQGPWDPAAGHRCNPNKLLLDPRALAIEGSVRWGPAVLGHAGTNPSGTPSPHDSAGHVPHAIVVDPSFDWQGDHHPFTPWSDTVIYEAHVKGLTQRHPDIPEDIRGTYEALGHPVIIEHLLSLGVTALELLPIIAHVPERHLATRGLTNYWGYNPIGWLAPHPAYAKDPANALAEVQEAVRRLHLAGIEVILDVVFNHTAEGDQSGPTLSLRGFDNARAYRHGPDPRFTWDVSGCGNTVNLADPDMARLAIDALHHWVEVVHVDGFRFDLASALGRTSGGGFAHDAPFLAALTTDPVLRRVKLIAEPWDLGHDGYRLGGFPPPMREWNDRFRDSARDAWRGAPGVLPELASRITGSADIFNTNPVAGRRPTSSINLVTAHDGFTLRDLVSYERRHNAANGHGNRDGHEDNRSWNCGAEGPTGNLQVVAMRARQQRNLLATLLLSHGVPMLLGGDEVGRTQHGNNNAYCQDNEISWHDWLAADGAVLAFTRRAVALRQRHPVLRRRWFADGRPRGDGRPDVTWFGADGHPMQPDRWRSNDLATVVLFLSGHGADVFGERGRPLTGEDLAVVLHVGADDATVMLPDADGRSWRIDLDTAWDTPPATPTIVPGAKPLKLDGRRVLVLAAVNGDIDADGYPQAQPDLVTAEHTQPPPESLS